MIYVPKGALILSHSGSLLGKIIRWGERKWDEKSVRVNHSMLVVEAGYWPVTEWSNEAQAWVPGNGKPDPIIVESDVTVRTTHLSIHSADKLVMYDVEMTEEERGLVAAEAGHHQGHPYAAMQLFAQLIDNKLLFGHNVFRRLCSVDPLDICSKLTGQAFQRIGVTFGLPGYAQSPDDQDEWLRNRVTLTDAMGRIRKVTTLWDDIGDR